jgi:tripartite-type tricarboxylate transporter receptor subunit TctC
MSVIRRRFMQLGGAALAASSLSRLALAQAYPARPVRILVGYAAGGSADLSARLMAQVLSERLGQQFIVENRPGASSNIATETVVRAPADGYMLLVNAPASVVNAALYEKLPFNFLRDTAPVAGIMRVPNVMVVHPRFPAQSVPEFIAYAKANPGKVNHASAGTGTASHMAGELFKAMTGLNLVHVPYRGNGPALIDLVAGQVEVGFDSMPSTIEHIRAGQLRALAVTTVKTNDALPGIRSMSEFVPGYESSSWYGMVAPRHTPSEIIDTLNQAIDAGLADPRMKAKLNDLGGTVLGGPPSDFGKLLAEETEKWARVVKFANVKAE